MYDYKPLAKLAKEMNAKEFPSPSTVFSSLNRAETNYFHQQMKDKNSAVYKATQAGTHAHRVLETQDAKDAMGEKILSVFNESIGSDIEETWGREMGLVSMSHRFKGKFDGVGVYQGKPTVWDYKKTNSRKTPSAMTKWFKQAAAYAIAHNEMYDTSIDQLAIFNIYGKEIMDIGSNVVTVSLKDFGSLFLDDLAKYYRQQSYIAEGRKKKNQTV